jgi:hypothetical protein
MRSRFDEARMTPSEGEARSSREEQGLMRCDLGGVHLVLLDFRPTALERER